MKIYAIVIFFILLLSVYFIVNNYLFAIKHKQEDSLNRLYSIAKTLSLQIDGDLLDSVLVKYSEKDAIATTKSSPIYYELHQTLRNAYLVNGLSSDIYTLVYDSALQKFEFGITSGESPYYRHIYDSHPEAFAKLYDTGGTIDPFEDEFGTWLSAIAPIKNSQGKVVSVLSVDRRFDDFEEEARGILFRNIAIALLSTLLLSASLYRILKQVLDEEEEAKNTIQKASQLLRQQNAKITSSIQYARRIQQALMQENNQHLKRASGYFHIYYPRDIVSGDFLWTHCCKHTDCLFIVNTDCTGHGVPGALMSILGITALNEIIVERQILEPSEILAALDERIKYLLHQVDPNKEQNKGFLLQDGMDLSLCKIDYPNQKLYYAGAHGRLTLVRNGQIVPEVFKGTRMGIGGYREKQFDTIEMPIRIHDRIHLYTDGFVDQFGGDGPRAEKLKNRRVLDCLKEHAYDDLPTQELAIKALYNQWKGQEKQIDDVSWITVEV